MKRILLFLSSFIIVVSAAAVLYMAAFPSGKFYVQAALGNSNAQFQLGHILASDDKKRSEAIYWLEKAAAQNHASVQLDLARLTFLGEGVEKSETQGAAWVRKAAENGLSRAQALLGVLYLGGIGVDQNFDEALKQFNRSQEKEAQALKEKVQQVQDQLNNLPPEQRDAQQKILYENTAADVRKSFMDILDEVKQPQNTE